MKVFNNVTDIVRDDMASTMKKGSKVAIAAACFSMYAYNELKKQLENVDELPGSVSILDFGCDSGRDTKYFLEKGYQVAAIDGSAELCR